MQWYKEYDAFLVIRVSVDGNGCTNVLWCWLLWEVALKKLSPYVSLDLHYVHFEEIQLLGNLLCGNVDRISRSNYRQCEGWVCSEVNARDKWGCEVYEAGEEDKRQEALWRSIKFYLRRSFFYIRRAVATGNKKVKKKSACPTPV